MGARHRLVTALVGVLAASFCIVLVACSTKAKLIAQGGDCFQATDCQDGLVCVPQQDGRRICDNDLSSVQKTEDATAPMGNDAGKKEGGADGGDTDTGAPPDDAGDTDTGGGTDGGGD